jgi:hypothetical protein
MSGLWNLVVLRTGIGRSAVLLFLVPLLLLAGCSTPDPVVLTGTVTDAYTGQPVAQAQVVVGETTLTTDATGSFATPNWLATDTLAVNAPNYAALTLPLEAEPTVVANETLTVTLSLPLRPNTLTGTITDLYTGEPVAGVDLAVTVDVSTTLTANTAADGVYTLTDLPEQFRLTVNAPGYEALEEDLARIIARDFVLRPNTLSGRITDRYSGEGVAGATVRVGDREARTAADGTYTVTDVPAGVTAVEVSADDYAPLTQELGQTTTLDAILRPDTLVGRLVDQASGEPLANATVIATTTFPGTDVAFTRIDASTDGVFRLEGMPEQGFLQIISPGYSTLVIPIEPGNIPSEFALGRFTVRALYITAAVATIPSLVERYVDLIERTELNAIMVDLKSDLRDDLGLVYYDTQVPLARELGLSANYIDMPALVQDLKSRGIYTIARIQLFSHDNVLSDARPEWSIRIRETGEVYADYPGPGIRYAYLDPSNRNVWDYNIQLGVEAALMGFDEINYDYIRFPDYFGTRAEFTEKLLFSEPLDAVNNPDRMFEVITEFMQLAHRAINGAGAKMSIDVFGRVVLGQSLTIAQDIQRMGAHTDYIAPMPYPSLWWPGAFGLSSPVEEPYAVLDAANAAGVERIRGQYARLRPWLQDHTDPWSYKVVRYGPDELRAQIEATEKYPEIDGWMLYDSANIYRGAFNGGVKPAP